MARDLASVPPLPAVSLETAAAGDSGATFPVAAVSRPPAVPFKKIAAGGSGATSPDKIFKSPQGFSLVEMLVTIAVLAVITTIGIAYMGGISEGSARTVAQRNLNLLNGAVTAYNQSNRNIAETLGSGGGASESSVVALLQAYDASDPTPGSPYLSPSLPCPITASTESYRAQWNGNFFQLIPKGTAGSGIDLGAMAGSVP